MSFSNVDWTLAGAVIITGISVVFFVLAFLWAVVLLIGKVVPALIKEPQVKQSAPPTAVAARPTISQEVVAAITAAVSTTTDKGFKIKSISLKGDNTPLWTGDN